MNDRGLELTFTGSSPQRFTQPDEVFVAYTQRDAWTILRSVEQLQASGYAVAGYLSYELGYACVDVSEPVRTDRTASMPYLVLGAFAQEATRFHDLQASGAAFSVTDFNPRMSHESYRRSLETITRGLTAGDYYQINLSVPFDFRYGGDPVAGFLQLQHETRAPYAAYLQYANTSLVSLSPELFLRFDGRTLTTKPMKGTAALDALATLESAKNRAEHIMIVDLLRNDLARVCTHVQVERLFEREHYPTFATMTSTIGGTLRPATPFHEIVSALFPCGSITGAPKRAAMHQIAALETDARNAYCGAIGYLLPDGRGEWNVAIRTAQLDLQAGTGRLHLGGGIVADSQLADEWNELEIKGRFFETAKFTHHDRV